MNRVRLFRKELNNDLYLYLDNKTFYVYCYKNKEMRKEIPFRSEKSALSFIDNYVSRN